MKLTPQHIATGLGVLGILGAAVLGYVQITTPKEYQCAVELADAKARLDLLSEAKEACKTALQAITTQPTSTPQGSGS